jgi:hypothetical protein
MKNRIIIIAGAFTLILGAMLLFIRSTIISSKGCSQIVIDTNELHSGIDIPDVDFINCYFDDKRKIRVSIYHLKLNEFQLDTYIDKFELVDQTFYSGITQIDIMEQPTTNKLYELSGTRWGNKWKYIVEPATGILWAEISYK